MKAELLEALQRTPKLPELQSDHDLIFNPTDYTEWYDKDDVVNFADEWEEFATVLREAVQELATAVDKLWPELGNSVTEFGAVPTGTLSETRATYETAKAIVEAKDQ